MNKTLPYAVFLDIDGTLVDGTGVISPRNAAAIKKAREAGHYVFINTGRALGNIPKHFFDFIDLTDGIVAGSGTYLEFNGKTFLDAHFDRSVLKEFCAFILGNKDLWAVLECKNGIIGLNSVPKAWGVKRFIKSENDFDDVFAGELAEVIAVGDKPTREFIELFRDKMRIITMSDFADCIPAGCSKANGMLALLKELNIPVERSIAVGDSENDLDMLAAAGISVAVANAAPKVLEAADIVTDSNVNDGVGKLLEKLTAAKISFRQNVEPCPHPL